MSAEILRFEAPAPPFDRRRHRRSAVPHISSSLGGSRIVILDMSRRGMSIESTYPFGVGGSYLFELSDRGRSLLVEGEIRWCHNNGSAPAHDLEEVPIFRTGVSFLAVQSRGPLSSTPDISDLASLPVESSEADDQLMEDRLTRLRESPCPDEAAELLPHTGKPLRHGSRMRVEIDEYEAA